MKYIKKFCYYLIPFWKREVLILFLGFISMGLGLVNPYLTKLIIDKAYGNKDLKLFIILAVSCGSIFILNGVFTGLSNYQNYYIKLRLKFDLNRKIFKKLQNLPYAFFQGTSTGEHLYKISYDVEQVSWFIADLMPKAIALIPKLIFIFIIIFFMNWKMALLALALMPFLYIVPHYFKGRLKTAVKAWVENSQSIFRKLQEVLSRIQLVKAFGEERRQISEYIKGLIQNIRFNLTNIKLEIAGLFANNLSNRIILGLILFYGGYQVMTGHLTLGSLSAISIYLSQLSGMQSSLAHFFQQVSLGLVSYERLEKVLEARPELTEEKDAKETFFYRGNIEFKNITFGYKQYKIILEGLSFGIAGSSSIGLVGHSGCGKTTIVNLLLRLYKPLSGEIMIDGHNINNIKSKSLYEQIGVVLQEPYLWDDTIENNIRYGKKDAGFKEIVEAAKIVCIDDFINGLDQKYKTVIGENACKISEGEKQRIAIARAIVKKPKILILDEAFSSVDSEVEARIIDNIRNFLNDSTIITISHRLSTIKKLDLIYFLGSSDKITIATHEELLADNIEYQDYFAHQLVSSFAAPLVKSS